MADAPFLPPEVISAALDIICALNSDDSIQIIAIAVRDHYPPAMVSTIHPEQVPDILKFLIDHNDYAEVTVDGKPVSKRTH